MYLLDRISKNIAMKMADNLSLDKEKEEILAYGAYSILQTGLAMFLVLAVGLALGVFWESLAVSFAAAFLRKYSGGAHASSPNRCAVIGVIIFVPLSLIINHFTKSNEFTLYIVIVSEFILTYLIVYKLSPVDSPQKPIKKEYTIKRLRKGSFALISLTFVISMLLLALFKQSVFILKIILSISTGFAWQSITLTSLGHKITTWLDNALMNITNVIKGGAENE